MLFAYRDEKELSINITSILRVSLHARKKLSSSDFGLIILSHPISNLRLIASSRVRGSPVRLRELAFNAPPSTAVLRCTALQLRPRYDVSRALRSTHTCFRMAHARAALRAARLGSARLDSGAVSAST